MRTQRSHRAARRAFTLIEILIVVVILGILAAIVIPQFAESSEAAQENAAHSTLQTVRSQFELCKFRTDCDCDPTQTIGALIDDLLNGQYLQSAPTMPDGYVLEFDGTNCRVNVEGQPW